MYDTICGRITLGVAGEPVNLWSGLDSRFDQAVNPVSPAVLSVVIRANANTSLIVVGPRWVIGAAATRQGLVIAPDQERSLPACYLDRLWMDGLTVGDGLFFMAWVSAAGPQLGQSVYEGTTTHA